MKQNAELGTETVNAVSSFKQEGQAGLFPDDAHSFHSKEELFPRLEIVPEPQEVTDDDEDMGGLYGVVPI